MPSIVSYQMRHMRLTDIPHILVIDQQSFSIPWAASSYAREVSYSTHSHMVVIQRTETVPAPNAFASAWRWMTGETTVHNTVLAYGGLWLFGAEAHISTIASHPRYRGQGWGEMGLMAMLRRAILLKATEVSLEVRVSNTRAQALYRKYGFHQHGVKRGYYYDNNEDAYDMRLDVTLPPHKAFIEERYRAYCARYAFEDAFTAVPKP